MMNFLKIFGIIAVLWAHSVIGTNSSNSTNISKQLAAAAQSNSIPSDYFKFLDSYYKLHTSATTWAEARRVCEAEGAHLTIVNSEDEAYFLVRLISETSSNYALIGFHDIFKEGDYLTIEGKSIRGSGYVHWAPNEPNNAENGNPASPENCGSFYRYGGLNDISCALRYPYICEIEVNVCN